MFATGMIPVMRNHGASFYAMCAMASGCLANIFLDYYFVIALRWGLAGAALATVFGQALTLIFSIAFFMKKENRVAFSDMRPDKSVISPIYR